MPLRSATTASPPFTATRSSSRRKAISGASAINGGVAQRLTTHPAEESRAAISPDGKTIAFSAAYEGPTEVYTMPIEGGVPCGRRSRAGTALVVGWTPAGEVLYTTRRFSTFPNTQLARVNPATVGPHAGAARAGERRLVRPDGQDARTSRGCRSRAATRSATREARRRTCGGSATATRKRRRSPPITRARARTRCPGTAASTSSATATAR